MCGCGCVIIMMVGGYDLVASEVIKTLRGCFGCLVVIRIFGGLEMVCVVD